MSTLKFSITISTSIFVYNIPISDLLLYQHMFNQINQYIKISIIYLQHNMFVFIHRQVGRYIYCYIRKQISTLKTGVIDETSEIIPVEGNTRNQFAHNEHKTNDLHLNNIREIVFMKRSGKVNNEMSKTRTPKQWSELLFC